MAEEIACNGASGVNTARTLRAEAQSSLLRYLSRTARKQIVEARKQVESEEDRDRDECDVPGNPACTSTLSLNGIARGQRTTRVTAALGVMRPAMRVSA
jgi:hypothetical protein